MSFVNLLLILHLAITFFLTGLIWIIQLVHYPLMTYVAESDFVDFESEHCRRIGVIVAPSMILEGALAVALCIFVRSFVEVALCSSGLTLSIGIWLSTFLIQVPIHNRLASGRSIELIQRLVSTNWIRTIAWSVRSLLALALCMESWLYVGASRS